MELVGEDPDYKEAFMTGYFRDGKRRIDMMIVTKDTGNEVLETMKMTFLMNAINMGLDVEIEAGSGEENYDLNFIKVHAPDQILQHFGLYYNIKKFFKTSHLEFVKSMIWEEKQMIQIIRRWYPSQAFSTFERSQIVYKVLLSVTFGSPENYIGINQLIDNNILVDVYPLHDGPRHLVIGQMPLEMNGRQALFTHWCGYKNLFRLVPLNMVREYLGERIGFFFAFYQFYNCFLFFLAIFGLFVFVKNYDIEGRNLQLNEHGMKNTFTMLVEQYRYIITQRPVKGTTGTTRIAFKTTKFEYPDFPICPKCRDMVGCPFRVMEAYRNELVSKVFLDNPLVFYMSFVTLIWGVLLYLLWSRQENYWYWMWETNEEDAKSLTRPEYRILPKYRKKSGKTPKIKKGTNERVMESTIKEEAVHGQSEPKFKNTKDFLFLLLAIIVVCIVYPILMIEMTNKLANKFRYVEEAARKLYPGPNETEYPKYLYAIDPKVGFQHIERLNHIICDIAGSLNGVFIMGVEMGWLKLQNMLMRKHLPRSEWQYERRHSSNLYGVTVLMNIILVSYYAFVKGSLYTFPDDVVTWDYPFQLGLHNCGLLYCTDEIFIILLTTIKTKMFYEQIMKACMTLPKDNQRDPNDYIPPVIDRTPCWEREFRLLPIHEDFITIQYNKLFIQFTILMFFIAVFPLGALVMFFWNLWHIKYLAKLLIIHGRRPLLVQTWGLGVWREILFVIPYIACFLNAVYLMRNNSLLDRKFNKRYWSHRDKRRFFPDYFMAFFNVTDYNWSLPARYQARDYKKNFPQYDQVRFCLFPAQYNRMITGNKLFVNSYIPVAGKWYLLWRQTLFIIAFSLLFCGIAFLLNTAIDRISDRVRDTKRVEEAVKQYGIEEIYKFKSE